MTGPEHYTESERLLDGIAELYGDLADENDERVATANATALQVMATMAHTHATLALAAATATIANRPADDHETWTRAVSDAG